MKKHTIFFVGLVVIVIVVALALTFYQVGLPGLSSQNTSSGFGIGGGPADRSLKLAETDSAIAPMSAPSAVAEVESTIPRKITKNGSLSLLVETAETTVQNIQAIAGSVAGYVSEANLYEVTPGIKAGSITIRIPADKFEESMTRIKELAIKVENENINANDVTDQFIDLEARLKNLEAEEVQYLDILKKAKEVEDIIKVTTRLNEVRRQIDSWQGQLKYLNSQIDFSTITVNLTAEKEVQIWGINWRPVTVIKQAVRSLLNGLVSYVNKLIAFVIFLPVIVLWIATILFILWIIWRGYKFFKKETKTVKKGKKSTS